MNYFPWVLRSQSCPPGLQSLITCRRNVCLLTYHVRHRMQVNVIASDLNCFGLAKHLSPDSVHLRRSKLPLVNLIYLPHNLHEILLAFVVYVNANHLGSFSMAFGFERKWNQVASIKWKFKFCRPKVWCWKSWLQLSNETGRFNIENCFGNFLNFARNWTPAHLLNNYDSIFTRN